MSELGHNPDTAQADAFYERTRSLYPKSLASHGPARSLEAYLAELQSQFDALPLTAPNRGQIAARIRQVEAEIDARAGS